MALDTQQAHAAADYYRMVFDTAVGAARPFYPDICTVIPSTRESETYVNIGAVPGMREWLGERQLEQLRSANYTLVNKHWENSIMIDKDKLADDTYSLYNPAIQSLANEAAFHPDELVADLILAGTSTVAWDGQYFFDTDHVWGKATASQSNAVTYPAASGTTPTADEFKAAYNQARVAMLRFKNDQNKMINRASMSRQSNLMVLIPPDLEQTACDALLVRLNATGGENYVLDGPRIVPWPYLTNAAVFYLINTAGPLRPFIFQTRQPITRGTKGEDDRFTKDIWFGSDARYNCGYGLWTSAIQLTFT